MRGNAPSLAGRVDPLVKGADQLRASLQRLLQINSVSLYETGLKKGKLNTRSLWKAPGGAKTLFKKKTVPKIQKDVAVVVISDASGSMYGRRFDASVASFVLLNEVLKTVNVPYEFLMFTEDHTPKPQFFVLKNFGSKITREQIIARCAYVEEKLGNNPDGEALLWAYRRLSARKEKKKILIVLSDGQPATFAQGDAAHHLKEVATAIDKRVDLFSIGLETDSPKHFYSNWARVDSANLAEMFLELAKAKLLPNS